MEKEEKLQEQRLEAWPKVAIIVLNWNGWRNTIECVQSLWELNYSNYQIIVVDNGSTDDSVDKLQAYLKDYQDKCILLVNNENLGFSEGVNVAVRHLFTCQLPPEFIFLLNNDAKIGSETLRYCVAVSLSENAAIVGVVIRSVVNGKEVSFGGGRLPRVLFINDRLPIEDKSFWNTDLVGGGAMLVRRDIIEERLREFNYFLDPRLFMYCDEIELCWWARKHNYRILMAGKAFAYHESAGRAGGKRYELSVYYMTRNRLILARRLLPLGLRLAFHCWYLPSRIALVVWMLIQKKASVARAILLGVFDGYRNVTGKWKEHPG
jgi:GT2 family glycosyltransferase